MYDDVACSKGKRFLITVAPGWPQYAWDASAIGVVDAFDMMSYSDPLEDLTSRVDLFTKTYKIPKSMLYVLALVLTAVRSLETSLYLPES